MNKKEERENNPRYEYCFEYSIKRKHYNYTYPEGSATIEHFHNFKFKIVIKAQKVNKDKFGKNNYELNIIEVEKLFRSFLENLPEYLNEHQKLCQTSCSIEDLADYVSIYFPKFLKANNVQNIQILKVKVWEESSENEGRNVSVKRKNFRNKLRKMRG